MTEKKIDSKYIVTDEQPNRKPKVKGFDKIKEAKEYYLDLLDEGKNINGVVTLYQKTRDGYRWLWESRPSSTSGRKKKGV